MFVVLLLVFGLPPRLSAICVVLCWFVLVVVVVPVPVPVPLAEPISINNAVNTEYNSSRSAFALGLLRATYRSRVVYTSADVLQCGVLVQRSAGCVFVVSDKDVQ